MEEKNEKLAFRFGWGMSFIPMLVFTIVCVLLFVVFKAFDMHALAMGGFVGLAIGALFVKNFKHYGRFWNAVMKGIASPTSVAVVLILFIIGMFSQLMKSAGVSNGFLWLAGSIGMKGGIYVAFVFLACCVISTATGSSIGTMFAAFPIFYGAGIALGASPMFLAGAILGGAVFGDNLAPISDTTIASCGTQVYRDGIRTAEISGAVASRFKYSIVAAIITTVLLVVLGGIGGTVSGSVEVQGSPLPLLMLIPVGLLLFVAIKTRDIFASVTVGLISGTIVALVSGLLGFSDIFNVVGGATHGFLADGVANMMGTVTLVISVFGIMGVLQEAGALDRLVDWILKSKLAKTPKGAEIAIMIGTNLTTLLFGGVTSASILTFGPVVNEIGRRKNIHPYRRANLLDGFANSIANNVPFLSCFVFIGVALSGLNPYVVAAGLIYTAVLFFVLLFAVLTGWGRRFEGKDGEELKEEPAAK
ncbi:MAG: Na+/H+ antiporter NhaC family protein [Candidatus Izemoplasmatales bacterium]